MTREELKDTLKKLGRARKKLDAAKAQYDALKDMCRDHMIEEKLETLELDGYQLEYKLIITNNVDVKALKKAMPELCERFSRVAESRRFTVTLPV